MNLPMGIATRINGVGRAFLLGCMLGALTVYFFGGALADNHVIRPDADGTGLAGTPVGCTSSLNFECLNDVVTQPTDPDTGTDYLELVNTDTNHSQLSTVTDVDVVTALTVWIYHREGGTNARTSVGLFAANETTVHGAQTTLPVKTTAGWDSVTYTGLALSQADLDAMRLRISCGKIGGGSSNDCFAYAAYVDVTFDPLIEVTVGTVGTQQNLDVGSTFAHVGGVFSIVENVGSRNVTSITIEETGSVDANDGLKNVALYYDLDTTAGDGYNCSDQSINGNEQQFGATSTGGFSGDNGTITFTDVVGITTTQTLCLYVILDVDSSALAGQTIELQITDPSTDVLASGTEVDVTPNTVVALSGTTIIQAQDRDQIHYHWRNDDGSENDPGGATSATGGTDDTTYDTLGKQTPTRLRLQVSNEGNKTSDSTQYRLEYGRKISTCDNVVNDSSWTDVGTGGGDWDMFDSSNLTEGGDTTDIAESIGGMPNANLTFLTPNGGIKDTSSQTAGITLTSSEFVELEYSIEATANATEGYTYCFRLTNAGSPIESYTIYPEATILADVNVSSAGTQRATVDIPTNDVDSGAKFVFIDNIAGDTTVQSITITASGSVDFVNDIDNIELWYDLDTTGADGYNCSDQIYNGGGAETQFGTTDTNGFAGDGTATFTGSQVINPTQSMCVYVVYDVLSSVSDGELLDIKIQDASTDVTIDAGTVSPAALVDLSGTTQFVTDLFSQTGYHWRNDNGSESGATSATGGAENTQLDNLRAGVPMRLRIGVANEGSSSTPAYQYRLEYALRVSTCGAATGWTDVGAADDEFNMYDSPNVTDGADTTNISVASGGVTDVGTTFFSNNNAVKDTSSQTAAITLPGKNYTDLEFALVSSSTATEGATYCFRVTDAGTPFASGYDQYPRVSIKPKTDFFIQRGVTTISGAGATISAGTHYVAPSSPANAFIRIVGTNNTGAGSPSNSGSADDVTAYVSNPTNIATSVTFARPATAVDTTRVAWEIIEYIGSPGGDNEIIVRQQSSSTYAAANTSVTTGTVSGIVDDNDVAVFITGQGNPDTATNYPYGLSTAAWNSGADTVTFTRGASSNAAVVSYAVVEFVGANWRVQRAEHTYTNAGVAEVETITAVDTSRAFLHTQKRIGSGLNNHADFGHNVYFSGLNQITFTLQSGASSPASHTSVAWVIENIQNVGDTMVVSRSNGSESAGTAPKTLNANIGSTISDTQDASLFINNHGNEAGGGSNQNSFPEPIISAELVSETQYQLWIAQPDNDTRTWRAEVVEWPTAARDIVQNYYRFYVNNDLLDPTDPWPVGVSDVGENTEVTVTDSPIALSEEFRLRMTLQISSAGMEPGIDNFKLQYGERVTTCDAIGEGSWHDVGDIGSTTALWRGTTTPLTDGTALSTDPPAGGALNISVSDVAGTFEEENPSAFTPYVVDPGEDVEFDWVVQHNGAKEKTTYCFRMLEASGTLFDDYLFYPAMRTAGFTPVLSRWRFYNDETSLTPATPLDGEGAAPSSIAFDNVLKLRTTIIETTGGVGTNAKFKLQYSDTSDFSSGVYDVVASSTCALDAETVAHIWCYDDGAGIDNDRIDAAVISDADTCSGGSGNGCGTHNEGVSTTTATFDHPAYATTEYEYTLRHDGARANVVYYFRLFDVNNATTVPASTTYPSLQVEGASLVFSVSGVDAGTITEGITTDATTTPTNISFGSVPLDTEHEVAQRITIDTNATEGYQVLMYARSKLLNSYGTAIEPVVTSNSSPGGWNTTACQPAAIGCFGYHSGDDALAGGSVRFSADDSYAALATTTEEVLFSSVPTVDVHDIIYKLQVSESQPAGDYETDLVYIAIPSF